MRRSKPELVAWARSSSRTRVSFCYSCLGETSSLGREYQLSPLFHVCSTKNNQAHPYSSFIYKHKHF